MSNRLCHTRPVKPVRSDLFEMPLLLCIQKSINRWMPGEPEELGTRGWGLGTGDWGSYILESTQPTRLLPAVLAVPSLPRFTPSPEAPVPSPQLPTPGADRVG